MSKNLIQRLVVAAIFIPAILWISYEGGWWLYGLVMFLAAIAISEFMIAEGYKLSSPAFWMILSGTLVLTSYYAGVAGELKNIIPADGISFLILAFLVIGMLFSIGKKPPAELFSRLTRLTWGLLYVGLLYPFVYLLGQIGSTDAHALNNFLRDIGVDSTLAFSGGDALLFLFAILWIGDTAAMWVGSTIGRHKLAPSVSPNKTVEGFIGGLVAAALVGVVMAFWKFSAFPLYQILIVAVVCSLFGQLGDLVESMWKRSLNIKDSSAIIPGHGGFLDRFDSLLFAAPVMYYFFVIFR